MTTIAQSAQVLPETSPRISPEKPNASPTSVNPSRNSNVVWRVAKNVFNGIFVAVCLAAALTPLVSTVVFIPIGFACKYRASKLQGAAQKKMQDNSTACFIIAIPVIGNILLLRGLFSSCISKPTPNVPLTQ